MPVSYTLAAVLTLRSGTIPVVNAVLKTGASVGAAVMGFHASDQEAFASIQHPKLARLATVGTNGTAQTPEKLTTRTPAATSTATQGYPTVGDEPAVTGNELIVTVCQKQAANPMTSHRHWTVPNPRYPVMVEPSSQIGITFSDSGAPVIATVIFDEPSRSGPMAERGRRSRTRGYQQYADMRSGFSGSSAYPHNNAAMNQHTHVITQDWPDEATGSDRFLNLLNSSGSVFNEGITLPVTMGMALTVTADRQGAISLAVALGFVVSSTAIFNSAVTFPVTLGFTVTGGIDYQAAVTFNTTLGLNVSVTVARQGAISLGVTLGFSCTAVLGAVGSISLPVTLGFVVSSSLTANVGVTLPVTLAIATAGGTLYVASVAMNVTMGIAASVTLSRQGAVSYGTTLAISTLSVLSAQSAVALGITCGITAAATASLNSAISLGSALSITILDFLGVIVHMVLEWDAIRGTPLSRYTFQTSTLSAVDLRSRTLSQYKAGGKTRSTYTAKSRRLSNYKAKGEPNE